MIAMRHELVKLAELIDWEFFETEWAGFFPSSRGRPATSPRLVAELPHLHSLVVTMSVAIADVEGDHGAAIVSGANLAIDATPLAAATLWAGVSVLILQDEEPEGINIAVARAARVQGVRGCLNAASAHEMPADLRELLDVFVVNSVEAREICGIAVDSLPDAARAAHALARRVPVAVVTAGGDGVAYGQAAGPSGVRRALAVKLVSTHGAGDVFVGSLCCALAMGGAMPSAVSQANLRAARHVSGACVRTSPQTRPRQHA